MKRAICIGCACDEDNACSVLGTPLNHYRCWWVRFDAEKRLGICSACWDLVKPWDAGMERKPDLKLIAERYYRQVLFLYEEDTSALAWLRSPQPLLGNCAPYDLILAGELERVRTVVDQLRTGAYV